MITFIDVTFAISNPTYRPTRTQLYLVLTQIK